MVPCRFCRITAKKSRAGGHYYVPHAGIELRGKLDTRDDLLEELILGVAVNEEEKRLRGIL